MMQDLMTKELDLKVLLRKFVLGLFVISVLGTGTELILLEHTEDTWMWVPLVLMGLSILIVAVHVMTPAHWPFAVFSCFDVAVRCSRLPWNLVALSRQRRVRGLKCTHPSRDWNYSGKR